MHESLFFSEITREIVDLRIRDDRIAVSQYIVVYNLISAYVIYLISVQKYLSIAVYALFLFWDVGIIAI